MAWKVLIADDLAPGAADIFRNRGIEVDMKVGLKKDELIKIIPGPDFPTKGIIYGAAGVREGYRTGRGRVLIRARTHKACKHMIAKMIETRANEAPKTQRLVVISEIASAAPQRDFINAEYDRDILTNSEQLFHAAEQGYNPIKYELIRNYRQGGRGRWVGVYQITFEKAV